MNKEEAKKQLETMKSEFEANSKKLLEIIERPEITPKQRLLGLMKGLLIDFDFEKYPNKIFYRNLEGKFMFELDFKNGYLWCSYDRIWSIFEIEFKLEYNQIQALIKETVGEHFKWGALTP